MADSTLPATFFIPFNETVADHTIPEKFTYPFKYKPHPLALLASRELQHRLSCKKDWDHNFGLGDEKEGAVIGKMFGVLVVKNEKSELGYLAAFSGKLAGTYHHTGFVPPVYDALTAGSFLNVGMTELSRINQEILALTELNATQNKQQIDLLLERRKSNSIALQAKLFDQFYFLNQAGKTRNLRELFRGNANNNPPAGAGECAAPKLLQYAFQHKLKPLALAEFWWGQSPKSAYWKHGHFYPACREKCAPILSHMLENIVMDAIPA